MTINELETKYHEWALFWFVERVSVPSSRYTKLLSILSSTKFTPDYHMDENRAIDAINLKSRFLDSFHNGQCLPGFDPIEVERFRCLSNISVFDIMVAISDRTYREITYTFEDPLLPYDIFWTMIESMGLSDQMDGDGRFNERKIHKVVQDMMYHRYAPDGKGGLFYVKDCPHDMREAELWYQMQYWVSSLFNQQEKKRCSDARFPNYIDSNN